MEKSVKGQIERALDGKLSVCGYELKHNSKIKLLLCDKWVTVKIKCEPVKCGYMTYGCNLDGLDLNGRIAKLHIKT